MQDNQAPSAAVNYILHLADNALIHGQRIAQWCSHGPVLEEDIAMANIGLDHIGQARMLYQHAANLLTPTLATACAALPPEGALAPTGGRAPLAMGTITEDKLAYFRNPEQFLNYTMLELPHRTAFAPSVQTEMNYAVTIARNFLYASLMKLVWAQLESASDAQLAAIAAKSSKEVRYHLRHSTDWMLRLGDGTTESHTRMQAALDYLMPFTQEWFTASDLEKHTIDMPALHSAWQTTITTVVTQATLKMPADTGYMTRGKHGQHSEHLTYLLTEMQSLAREHPLASW